MPLDIEAYAKAGAELRVRFLTENQEAIRRAGARIADSLRAGGKVLLFGNGGSAADAQHVAAELVGRFRRTREALAAVALTTDASILTSLANDLGFEEVFARQIRALGRPGDVAVAISTSGDSLNVLSGVAAARERGLFVVGLLGRGGGRTAGTCDLSLIVPSAETPLIQEVHLAVEHVLCDLVDEAFATGPA